MWWCIKIGLSIFINIMLARPIEVLFSENKIDEAKKLCSQYNSLSSTNWKDLFDCSWVYFYDGDTQNALQFMEKMSKESSSVEYNLLQAFSHLKKKKFDKALKIVNTLRTKVSDSEISTKIEILAALIYEEMDNLAAAGFIYKQLAKNRNLGIAQWGAARYHLSRQEFEKAKQYLINTTKIWKNHLASRYNLAIIALNEDRIRDAAKWLSECYKINKNDPEVLEALGNLFEKRKKIDEAIKYWKKAFTVNKNSKNLQEKIGKYTITFIDKLIEQKRFNDALNEIKNYDIKHLPEVILRLGIIYRNLGKFEDALRELLVYHKDNQNDPRVLRELGIVYLNLKLLDKASQFFINAISLEPNNGMNYAWLGWTMEAIGEFEKAEEAWEKAVEFLKDPSELAKATRKLATIQQKVRKKKKN